MTTAAPSRGVVSAVELTVASRLPASVFLEASFNSVNTTRPTDELHAGNLLVINLPLVQMLSAGTRLIPAGVYDGEAGRSQP